MTLLAEVPLLLQDRLGSPGFVLLCLVAVLVPLLSAYAARRPSFDSKAPPVTASNLPLIGSYGFFSRRWEFMRTAAAQSTSGNFAFHLGKHAVVGLSGDVGRRTFFESSQLDFGAGPQTNSTSYAVLFDAGPQLDEDMTDEKLNKGYDMWFARQIKAILKNERLATAIPTMTSDVRSRLNELGAEGIMDPFDTIYRVVYLMTMRLVGCREIAEDRALLDKSLGLFAAIEASSTPASVIAPWAPLPSRISRLISGTKLFMMFKGIIDARQRADRREDDALQLLIDGNVATQNIMKFVIGAVFAGQINTGVNVSAQLCYLAVNREWHAICLKEIQQVAARYAPDASVPLVDQLEHIPTDGWRNDFEMLDLALRECIRLQLLGAAFRRNTTAKDVVIKHTDGTHEVIPPGAFATYNIADVHYNPNFYTDPTTWDPSRFLPDRAEDKKAPHAYAGWGSGRHPCLGISTAKLENTIVLAHFVAMFDWELRDVHDRPLARVPDVDLNNWSAAKPKTPVRLRYRLKEELRRASA